MPIYRICSAASIHKIPKTAVLGSCEHTSDLVLHHGERCPHRHRENMRDAFNSFLWSPSMGRCPDGENSHPSAKVRESHGNQDSARTVDGQTCRHEFPPNTGILMTWLFWEISPPNCQKGAIGQGTYCGG
ncbi:hypothetical protein EVAR_6837_1 [Eumeta japonica]|uniref:Uncharacterized protein n=1 Tax=Eumeta variegata TaxID=151549 RepID=A0A4C1U684_EUMVA|nr:hypothetical protein EVAR_6837_1 [Eumeta japonica]